MYPSVTMKNCLLVRPALALGVGVFLTTQTGAQATSRDADNVARHASHVADSLLALMTLGEKLGQLTQATAGYDQTGPSVDPGGEKQLRAGQLGSLLNLYGADAVRRTQRIAVEGSRLHIPLLLGYDVIHGMRTIFPVPLAIAASFDSSAAARMARISATEASAIGVNLTFAPMVDIARDARWWRIVPG